MLYDPDSLLGRLQTLPDPRRRLLLSLRRLEQLSCHLGGIDGNAGEARVVDWVALDDQFILWILERLGDFPPLLLTDGDQVVGRLLWRCW